MDWQEVAVALIGVLVVVRLLSLLRRRRRGGGGCPSCDADCPYRGARGRKRRRR